MVILLKNGDALELLKEIPSESVDIVVTDPPYNISQEGKVIPRKNMHSKIFKSNSDIRLDFGEWDRRDENEFYNFTEQWFKECARILKPRGWFYSFFSSQRLGYFSDPRNGLFVNNGFKFKTLIAWHKTNPVPSFRKANYLASLEFIVVGTKGESKIPNFIEQKRMHNFYETPNSTFYGETIHPTEKPVELLQWIIYVGSKEGDTVLDPFMGTGSTGVAAVSLNRNFIGIEISKEYYDIAQKRINSVRQQLKLDGQIWSAIKSEQI